MRALGPASAAIASPAACWAISLISVLRPFASTCSSRTLCISFVRSNRDEWSESRIPSRRNRCCQFCVTRSQGNLGQEIEGEAKASVADCPFQPRRSRIQGTVGHVFARCQKSAPPSTAPLRGNRCHNSVPSLRFRDVTEALVAHSDFSRFLADPSSTAGSMAGGVCIIRLMGSFASTLPGIPSPPRLEYTPFLGFNRLP